MPFVVKAIGPGGYATWFSPPSFDGFRSLASRDTAEVFHDVADAHVAIAKMPRAINEVGIIFSVESADQHKAGTLPRLVLVRSLPTNERAAYGEDDRAGYFVFESRLFGTVWGVVFRRLWPDRESAPAVGWNTLWRCRFADRCGLFVFVSQQMKGRWTVLSLMSPMVHGFMASFVITMLLISSS